MPGGGRRGVLGGTFDPPHRAHLALAAAARDHLALDRVLFVPAGDPWRKRGRRRLSPAPVRLRLVRAAVEGIPWAEVSDVEVRRAGPSYTADTLEALAAAGGAWWFILGADALADMPHWHAPERIVAAARLAVARRPGAAGSARELVPAALRALVPDVDARVDLVPFTPLDVSSTDVRARIAMGEPTDDVSPRVRAVIDELGLYR